MEESIKTNEKNGCNGSGARLYFPTFKQVTLRRTYRPYSSAVERIHGKDQTSFRLRVGAPIEINGTSVLFFLAFLQKKTKTGNKQKMVYSQAEAHGKPCKTRLFIRLIEILGPKPPVLYFALIVLLHVVAVMDLLAQCDFVLNRLGIGGDEVVEAEKEMLKREGEWTEGQ